jgi:hypothetical protein
LLIRTQTALPEGVVYGIAVENLVSPIIYKYTVGLTNQFLKQRYLLLTSMMVFAIGITVLPTMVNADSSSSSSQPVVIPYATYRGEYSSYFSDYDEEPTLLAVDVGVDRDFNIVKIDILQGISSAGYASSWTAGGQAILNQYLSMDVAEVLAIDPTDIPTSLTITGTSMTTNRLLRAIQNAFDGVVVLEGRDASYACDECDTPDEAIVTVYVQSEDETILGIGWSGILATSQPYLGIIEDYMEAIQDYYLGMTVTEVLALTDGPIYPTFNPSESGATISFTRLYDALIDALGDYHG